MPKVPISSDMRQSSVYVGNPAQINHGALDEIGKAGRAMGTAVASLGDAFGEVAGRVGAANDSQNLGNAQLYYEEQAFAIKQDMDLNAGEDGAGYSVAPEKFGKLEQDVFTKFPVSNPKQRQQLEQHIRLKTFHNKRDAALNYQKGQVDYQHRVTDGHVTTLIDQIDGGLDDEAIAAREKGILDRLGGGVGYTMSRSDYEKRTRQIKSQIQGARLNYLLKNDPAGAEEYVRQHRTLTPEIEAPGELGAQPQPQRPDVFNVKPLPGGSMGRGKRSEAPIGIVVHHTAGNSLEGAIEHGRKTGTGASYYVVADPNDPNNATVYEAAGKDQYTAHIRSPNSPYRAAARAAGVGTNLSSQNTYGIEVVAKNDQSITPGQRAFTARLVEDLAAQDGIKPQNIVGHGDIQGGKGGNKERDEGTWIKSAISQPGGRQRYAQLQDQRSDAGSGNYTAATRDLQLNPQEQALYQRHLQNLNSSGGVNNEDGTRSSLKVATVEADGRTYLVPTVRDGKILPPEEAIKAAEREGFDKFPSYATREEAEQRYKKLHDYMEKDTAAYQRRGAAPQIQTPPVAAIVREIMPDLKIPQGGLSMALDQYGDQPLRSLPGFSRERAQVVQQRFPSINPNMTVREAIKEAQRSFAQEETVKATAQRAQGGGPQLQSGPTPASRPGGGANWSEPTVLKKWWGEPSVEHTFEEGYTDKITPQQKFLIEQFGEQDAGRIMAAASESPNKPLREVIPPALVTGIEERFPELAGNFDNITVKDAITALSGAGLSAAHQGAMDSDYSMPKGAGAAGTKVADAGGGWGTQVTPGQQGGAPAERHPFPLGRVAPGQEIRLKGPDGKERVFTSDQINAVSPEHRKIFEKEQLRLQEANRVKAEIKGRVDMDDAEYLMGETGQVPKGYQEAREKWEHVFTKTEKDRMDLIKHDRNMRIAQKRYEAWRGANEIPPEMLRKQVGDLRPNPYDPDARAQDAAFKDVDKRLEKFEKLRTPGTKDFDPVEIFDPSAHYQKEFAIKPTGTVKDVRDKAFAKTGGEPTNQLMHHQLVDARIKTQLSAGIEPLDVRPLSARETKVFQGVVMGSGANIEDGLAKAYELVKKQYGNMYGGLIMKQVAEELAEKSRKHATAPAILEGMAENRLVAPLTLDSARQREIELGEFEDQVRAIAPKPQEKSWGDYVPWRSPEELRKGFEENKRIYPMQNRGPYPIDGSRSGMPPPGSTPKGPPPKPTDEDLNKLQADPKGFGPVFEQKYGREEFRKRLLPKD